MPHVFVNRARYHAPTKHGSLGEPHHVETHISWEVTNAIAYQVGGFIFIAGSVLFLPKFEEHVNVGSWLYVVGSLFYLVVSGHDLMEVTRLLWHLDPTGNARAKEWQPSNADTKTGPLLPSSSSLFPHKDWNMTLDLASAAIYFVGTLFYIVGSLLFLPSVGKYTVASWTFILGSLLFIAGAVVNALQIFSSPTWLLACFANLTAVSYVIGSTLFLTGSVPYLFQFANEEDERIVYDYLGWQFIVGSIAFTIGGAWNFVRLNAAATHHRKVAAAALQVWKANLRSHDEESAQAC